MPHEVDVPHLLGLLAIMLGAAKICGFLAQRAGQPAVLGELVAGVLVGTSVLGLVNFKDPILHFLGEVGVVLLLFEIGMETDLAKLLQVGGAAMTVACVGVALPFAMGYALCRLLGLEELVSIVAGAALTATSIGITARVLSELGRLQEPESQIILGAAIIDDVIGLVILAVVAGLAEGKSDGISPGLVLKITGLAVGFLVLTLVLGRLVVPIMFRLWGHIDLPGTATMLAVMLAFGVAWLAHGAGSAPTIGAFAAGLLLATSPYLHEIKTGVAHLGHFFVPLFFVVVGAAVDVRVLNPFDAENWPILQLAGLLLVAAIVGKFLAGYAPWWFKGKKHVIGVGMIPRGEVGLIFAGMGLTNKVFDAGRYSAVLLVVMLTTFLTPPILKIVFPPKTGVKPAVPEGLEELVTEA